MKLFVIDKATRNKIYLNIISSTRSELARIIGSPWFNLNGKQYHVHEVVAEANNNNTALGAIVGGLVGLLGGPAGVIVGGAVGGAIGNENDKKELRNIRTFNNSRVDV